MYKKLLISAFVFTSAHSVAATYPDQDIMSNFSYDYLEARIGVDPVTYGAALSMSVHPNAHLIGRIDSRFKGDFDAATGFGFHAPVNNWADFTGEMLLRINDKRHNGNAKTGMELNLGVRQWLGPQLEVGGKVGFVSIHNDEDWIASLSARFHSTELFSMGGEVRLHDAYGDQLMFTARFKY